MIHRQQDFLLLLIRHRLCRDIQRTDLRGVANLKGDYACARRPAVGLDPGYCLRLAAECALGPDNDPILAQRDAVPSIPLNEDVIG